MKKIVLISLIIGLFGVIALEAKSWSVKEKEEIRKTFKFQDPSKPRELLVDNIFGSIEVEGYEGQEVKLFIYKTLKGQSKKKIQKAREEVKLEITEEGNTIDLYVDGPFRCHNKRGRGKKWRDPGYEVQFDFDLKVPQKINLYLQTVNNGNIEVQNVDGEFEIKNVNGKIVMTEVGGAGQAHTVNGEVRVLFSRNPESDCSFHTINGPIEITFCKNLSADFRLKTFNGEAYSDYPFSYISGRAAIQGRKKGKYVYKSDRFIGIRVSKGGPEIKMDTLNGNILISKRKI
jgi:hypothetical protein